MHVRAARITICILGAVAGGACFLGDLFGPAGSGDVRFLWTGDTVLTSGVATPISVSLTVDGLLITEPRVELAIPDTTVLKFGATHDTIIGCRSGRGEVVARVNSSLSPFIDSAFSIHVTGGPACP